MRLNIISRLSENVRRKYCDLFNVVQNLQTDIKEAEWPRLNVIYKGLFANLHSISMALKMWKLPYSIETR